MVPSPWNGCGTVILGREHAFVSTCSCDPVQGKLGTTEAACPTVGGSANYRKPQNEDGAGGGGVTTWVRFMSPVPVTGVRTGQGTLVPGAMKGTTGSVIPMSLV